MKPPSTSPAKTLTSTGPRCRVPHTSLPCAPRKNAWCGTGRYLLARRSHCALAVEAAKVAKATELDPVLLGRSFRHELRPGWLWSSRSGEVGEFADLVDFHRGPVFAELAPARLEPGDQLLAADGDRGWLAV